MNIRFEFSEDADEEIVIRCRAPSPQTQCIMRALEGVLNAPSAILLLKNGCEYILPYSEILYFETAETKVFAHTHTDIFTAPHTLAALEQMLPSPFVRVSKSCIVNIMHIERLRRELVGNGEIGFTGCPKCAYFSRSYYRRLYDKIKEMRLEQHEQ